MLTNLKKKLREDTVTINIEYGFHITRIKLQPPAKSGVKNYTFAWPVSAACAISRPKSGEIMVPHHRVCVQILPFLI